MEDITIGTKRKRNDCTGNNSDATMTANTKVSNAIEKITCSLPVLPSSLSPGQTPKMLPTAKLASMIDEPSKGSKPTE